MRPCCYGFFIRIVIFMDIGNTCGRAPMANAFVKWVVVGALLAFPTRWLLGDATVPDLTLLKVKGNELMANGREFHLRGINWGWWHSNGTKYSEADMQSLAAWGANVIRLGFSYSDLETDDTPPVWKEDGFKAVDEVVQWGKRNGVYVILDMNVAPGGQGLQSYCAGGRDQLWTDSASQDRFVGLWSEIAKRYQDRPEVAAYELMNEPQTNAQKPDPNQVVNMDKRAISAIRTVDFNKVIVVGGDFGSGPDSLTDAMKIADDNILYTFHFFEATGHFHDEWISTVPGATSAAGSQDWTQVDENFTAPEKADQMCVLLRSDHNSGTAWFDDIQVADSHGTVLQSATFDTDPQGFRSERWTSIQRRGTTSREVLRCTGPPIMTGGQGSTCRFKRARPTMSPDGSNSIRRLGALILAQLFSKTKPRSTGTHFRPKWPQPSTSPRNTMCRFTWARSAVKAPIVITRAPGPRPVSPSLNKMALAGPIGMTRKPRTRQVWVCGLNIQMAVIFR
jgi:hypothetical protein